MRVKGAKLSPPAQPEAGLYLRYADVEGSWLLRFVAVCRYFRRQDRESNPGHHDFRSGCGAFTDVSGRYETA